MRLRMSALWLYLLGAYLIGVSCTSDKETRRVLVIHSYEDSYQPYRVFNEQIEKQFRKNNISADIRTLYLDCDAYNEVDELAQMTLLLDSATKDWKPEVILVNEDQATYSLLVCDHQLIQHTPVVFAGVNFPNKKLIRRYPNVTGFHDRIDLIANIEVVKELFGEHTDLFTLLDYTYLDRQSRVNINQQIVGHKVVIDTTSLDVREFLHYRNTQGYTNLLIIGTRFQQAQASIMGLMRRNYSQQCYIQLKRDFTTANIGNICNKPSMTAINESFGFGEHLLGGYMTPLSVQIQEQVDAAVRILHGTHPLDIPVQESSKEYILDWNVMQQWDIPYERVSSKYRVVNIPFWQKYPLFWFSFFSLVVLSVLFLIVRLFVLYHRERDRKKAALEALSDEKQNLALAIEGSNTYVWKYENGFFVIEKSFWDALNLPAHELSVEQMLRFIHPDSRDRVSSWNNSPLSKKIEQTLCNFNGRDYQWWEFRYTTIPTESGFKMAGLLLNIQGVKDRERELEEAKLLAEKAEQKNSFLANMSHEIRTPLNLIVGFSNLLASDEEIDSDEKQVYVDTINQNNDLLLRLINDILEITRLESGAISFKMEEFVLATFIDNVYDIHRTNIPAHLDYIKEADPTPLIVQSDTLRLTQVIAHFLNNAIKFTQTGHIKLGYRYLPEHEQVTIFVEDTGRGIPLQEQKMVFDRFYKQDGFTQGAGLGLSISQVIVERLRGEITMWSEFGVGSRFMITLPCKLESIEPHP